MHERIGFSSNKHDPHYKVQDEKNTLTIDEMNT
jgi:salicylate hydroxylase